MRRRASAWVKRCALCPNCLHLHFRPRGLPGARGRRASLNTPLRRKPQRGPRRLPVAFIPFLGLPARGACLGAPMLAQAAWGGISLPPPGRGGRFPAKAPGEGGPGHQEGHAPGQGAGPGLGLSPPEDGKPQGQVVVGAHGAGDQGQDQKPPLARLGSLGEDQVLAPKARQGRKAQEGEGGEEEGQAQEGVPVEEPPEASKGTRSGEISESTAKARPVART